MFKFIWGFSIFRGLTSVDLIGACELVRQFSIGGHLPLLRSIIGFYFIFNALIFWFFIHGWSKICFFCIDLFFGWNFFFLFWCSANNGDVGVVRLCFMFEHKRKKEKNSFSTLQIIIWLVICIFSLNQIANYHFELNPLFEKKRWTFLNNGFNWSDQFHLFINSS